MSSDEIDSIIQQVKNSRDDASGGSSPDPSRQSMWSFVPDQAELDRCRLMVKEKGVAAADALASNLRARADQLKEAVDLAVDALARLATERVWLEALPEYVMVTSPGGLVVLNESSESHASTEVITQALALERNQNAQQFERSVRDRHSKTSLDLFIRSETIILAILQEDNILAGEENASDSAQGVAPTALPFPHPEEVIYRPGGVTRLKSNALWSRLSQWLVNEIVIVSRAEINITRDKDLAAKVDGRLQHLLRSDRSWIAGVIEREKERRRKLPSRPIKPIRFGREQLRDLKGPVLAGDFGKIDRQSLDELQRIFQRGAEGG